MPRSFPARENKTGAFSLCQGAPPLSRFLRQGGDFDFHHFSDLRLPGVILSNYPPLANDLGTILLHRVVGTRHFLLMTRSISRTRSLWIALIVFALIGIGAFLFPAFIIRPFRYQGARELLWAMALRQRAPLISLLCAIACLLFVVLLWQNSNKWHKALLAIAALLLSSSAVMSRLNYFEWMFHPVDSAKLKPSLRANSVAER